ncbi:MAG: hypothetical protein R3Y44_02815 [Rikenellaceae bacterium]
MLNFTNLKRLFILLPVLFIGCAESGDDYPDVDGATPVITFPYVTIQSEAGADFTVEATITDSDGLSTVQVIASTFLIQNTIDIIGIYGEPLTEYELSYKMSIPDVFVDPAQLYEIMIVATDVGGRVTTERTYVSTDGDATKPIITGAPNAVMTIVTDGVNSVDYTLSFTVTDNKGLKDLTVSVEGLSSFSSETIEIAGGALSYDYSRTLTFPGTITSYNASIVGHDLFENEVSYNFVFSLYDGIPDYDKMYLIENGTTNADLVSDVYGVPMMVARTDAFTYTAYYYTQSANTKVYIIDGKTSLSGFYIGIDPNDSSAIISDIDTAEPFVLPLANTYYKLMINVEDMIYSIESYEPNDTDNIYTDDDYIEYSYGGSYGSQVLSFCLAGEGLPAPASSWSTSNGYPLTRDAVNPYLYSAEMSLTAGGTINFTISPEHEWGWWPEPYWRFSSDANIAEEANAKNAGGNYSLTVPATATYKFEFDMHLLRSKIYPIE